MLTSEGSNFEISNDDYSFSLVEYRSSRGNSNYRVLTGGWTCNNTLFGDPDVGYKKECY